MDSPEVKKFKLENPEYTNVQGTQNRARKARIIKSPTKVVEEEDTWLNKDNNNIVDYCNGEPNDNQLRNRRVEESIKKSVSLNIWKVLKTNSYRKLKADKFCQKYKIAKQHLYAMDELDYLFYSNGKICLTSKGKKYATERLRAS